MIIFIHGLNKPLLTMPFIFQAPQFKERITSCSQRLYNLWEKGKIQNIEHRSMSQLFLYPSMNISSCTHINSCFLITKALRYAFRNELQLQKKCKIVEKNVRGEIQLLNYRQAIQGNTRIIVKICLTKNLQQKQLKFKRYLVKNLTEVISLD